MKNIFFHTWLGALFSGAILFPPQNLVAADHPNLFFSRTEIARLQERAQRKHWSRLIPQIDLLLREASPYLNRSFNSPTSSVVDSAQAARFLAMVTLTLPSSHPDYPLFAQKAREALKNINTGNIAAVTMDWQAEWGPWNWDNTTNVNPWYVGEVLSNYAQAYDWYIGACDAGLVPPEYQMTLTERVMAKSRLLMLAAMIHDRANRTYGTFLPGQTLIAANMRLRVLAGLGMIALLFPDFAGEIPDIEYLAGGKKYQTNTSELLNWVIHDLFVHDNSMDPNDSAPQGTIANYITPDGLYNEGASYQNDSFAVLLPFLKAYANRTGKNFLQKTDIFDDRIGKMFEWNARSLTPAGHNPTLNTGWHGGVAWGHGIAATMLNNPLPSQWYFNEVEGGSSANLNDLLFIKIPPSPTPRPEYRTEFLLDAGIAVFRDHSGPDGTYLILSAEKYPARGHRQGDQTSFALYSKGSYMAIDPGDGRNYEDKKHNWMLSAYAHNVITADAQRHPTEGIDAAEITNTSPYKVGRFDNPGDIAQLKNSFARNHLDYTEAHMRYSKPDDVSLVRKVAFVRHAYFVIADELSANKKHSYRWQLHLGTDSTKGQLTTERSRYTWTMPGAGERPASLDVNFLKGFSAIGMHGDAPTNIRSGVTSFHAVLVGHADAMNHHYLSVLVPRWADEIPPSFFEIVAGSAWKIMHANGDYDIVIRQRDDNPIRVDLINTNAPFLIASFSMTSGQPKLISVLATNTTKLDILQDRQWRTFNTTRHDVFYYESSSDNAPHEEPGVSQNAEPLFYQVFNSIVYPGKNHLRIHYEVNAPGTLSISVLDRSGETLATLLEVNALTMAGDVFWDGRNNHGQDVASGTYLLRISHGSLLKTAKVVVVK